MVSDWNMIGCHRCQSHWVMKCILVIQLKANLRTTQQHQWVQQSTRWHHNFDLSPTDFQARPIQTSTWKMTRVLLNRTAGAIGLNTSQPQRCSENTNTEWKMILSASVEETWDAVVLSTPLLKLRPFSTIDRRDMWNPNRASCSTTAIQLLTKVLKIIDFDNI